MASQPVGTVTLLFTDIEGSTRLLGELGREAYADVLARHRAVMRSVFDRHGGYEVDCAGDGFFVAFGRAEAAVAAAAEAQSAARDDTVRVRMGIHTGEPLVVETAYVGMDVHRAARIMASAHGGQVVVSGTTAALLDGACALLDLGEHRLKDLSAPQRLHQLVVPGCQTDFPALRTLGGERTNLPVQLTAFVGREADVKEVTDRLRGEPRLVTLVGPGGIGKTRLSLQAAAEVSRDFADGTWFVGLAPVAVAESVLPQIADVLEIQQSSVDTVSAVAGAVGSNAILLVLDNFEHVLDAAADVTELLRRCPNVKVLATSRERLRVNGEHVHPVESLAVSRPGREEAPAGPAVELFVSRALAVRPTLDPVANLDVIGSICARLDGMPLAIELAAARVATLEPPALLRRLDRRLDTLSRGDRDADHRQRTLRNTIAWSYDLLDDSERSVFRHLAVFADGARTEAADVVCGHDLPVGELLDGLVERNVLRVRADPDGEPRYWMFETIREFALEQLRLAGDEERVRRRHAEWVGTVADHANSVLETDREAEGRAAVDLDAANIRDALAWSLRRDTRIFRKIVLGLSSYWVQGTRPAEALPWLERAHELTATGDEAARGALLRALFWSAYFGGRFTEARKWAAAREAFAEAIGDERERLRALSSSAALAFEEGDLARYRQLSEHVDAWRELADEAGLAKALINVGVARERTGDQEGARDAFAEGAALFEKAGNQGDWAHATHNLGWPLLYLGDIDGAARCWRDSLPVLVSLGYSPLTAWAITGIAFVAADRGDPALGARLLGSADRLAKESGHQREPRVQDEVDRLVEALEARIETATFEAEHAFGERLPTAAAVELALSVLQRRFDSSFGDNATSVRPTTLRIRASITTG